jgi:flagellar protein FliO/FliZ
MTANSVLMGIAALACVLALIVAATRLYKFGILRPQSRTGRTLILRESIALDPRRRVHLVQCGQRQVVLLTGGANDLIVGWLHEP